VEFKVEGIVAQWCLALAIVMFINLHFIL